MRNLPLFESHTFPSCVRVCFTYFFAFKIINFDDFFHENHSWITWVHNIHDIRSKCNKSFIISNT